MDPVYITDEDHGTTRRGPRGPVPGVLVVFCSGRPELIVFPAVLGTIALGRNDLRNDTKVSGEHVEITVTNGTWRVRDLNSRNGTWVDGRRLGDTYEGPRPRVIRVGSTLLVPRDDVEPFGVPDAICAAPYVAGPALRATLDAAARAARMGDQLLVLGESGAGKEIVAHAFHAARNQGRGPFVTANCAAIPGALAEAQLFGARRGAFTGATADTTGYFEAARGGVLFLDEVAEMSLDLQAKLLRVIENHEVVPLGGTKGTHVDFAVCMATNRDLHAAVATGRFRADLYYRIVQPKVVLPPLRERPEEIAWLVYREVRRLDPGLEVEAALVETCLLRPWPGNVRELLAELRSAVARALGEGARAVKHRHLADTAGLPLGAPPPAPPAPASVPPHQPSASVPSAAANERATIVNALRAHGYNVSAVARQLGLYRNQLNRKMKALDIKVARGERGPGSGGDE